MVGLLVVGFVCTELIRPVADSYHEPAGRSDQGHGVSPVVAVLAWLWVLVPFGYGLYQLLIKIPALFGH